MSDTLNLIKAAWPLLKKAVASGQVLNPQCDLVEPSSDIAPHYDVEIPMSEGFTLTANIFRSHGRMAEGDRDPVVMCAHPYDNRHIAALGGTPFNGPPQQYRLIPQSGGKPRFSTLASWESPDPEFWVQAGYTLVNLNLPGYANSGGPPSILSEHQGRSYREAIAWVGEQDWCAGHVGLCGVSFLCISQYLAAATPDGEEPPAALKAIIPWEGVSDLYRDLACRGGVPDTGFLNFWWHTEVLPSLAGSIEDYLAVEEAIPPEVLAKHPDYDAFWQAKAPPLENITVPMLLCASFSDHELHTFGSFRAFEKASSEHKWLYTHRSGKWTEFYKAEALQVQREFFDRFLKGEANGFENRPSVRLEVRSARDEVHEVRNLDHWPPSLALSALYLKADRTLSAQAVPTTSRIEYRAIDGKAVFDFVFEEPTEITGYMKLKVFIEVAALSTSETVPSDATLCCFIDKYDIYGERVPFYGTVGQNRDALTRGYGRASRRALDRDASTPLHPIPACLVDEPIGPGDIVPIEVAFCPSSTFFDEGESLRLTISGSDIIHSPIFRKDVSTNQGKHVIHIGGEYASHLLLPIAQLQNLQD
ncbi:MAG: CocE/NonD family hydrolase [Pseudomonadota bacterium]